MASKRLRQAQKGRSMIEMLGVLAIVGILSAGGIAGYSMAMQTYKTNLLIERIQLLSSRIRTAWKNGDYSGLTNTTLINSGKISAKDLENPFGGTLTVRYGAALGKGYFYIDISPTPIPVETCIDLIMTYWGDESVFWGMGTGITSNTAGTMQFRSDQAKKPYPANFTDAKEACEDTTENAVNFYFK